MDPGHDLVDGNDDEVVDEDFTTTVTPGTISVLKRIASAGDRIEDRLWLEYMEDVSLDWDYVSFYTLSNFLYRLFRLSHLWDEWRRRNKMLADRIVNDFVRIFEPISRIDVRRAAWTFSNRRDKCDTLFQNLYKISEYIWERNGWARLEWKYLPENWMALLGDAIWLVSCKVPRSPSPPPPYSLFDLTSPTDNFALNYHAMPMLPPQTLPSVEDRTKIVSSTKRKRITSGASGATGRHRKRARKRRAIEHSAMDYGLHPRISEIA